MEDQRKTLVLASFVADSLALGAHWIYDTERIIKEFGRIHQFLNPLPDSYHPSKQRGEFTHYGDQAMVLLESIADRGVFDLEDFSTRWRALFSDYKGYLDQATKATLHNFSRGKNPRDAGSSSSDLAGASRISPLVCRYVRDLDALVRAAKDQTRMTHNHPMVLESAEFFARLCWRILQGESPVSAIMEVTAERFEGSPISEWVEKGLASQTEQSVDVIGRFGRSCHVDEAFPGVVHLIAKYETDLKEALIQSVMAGGDSAARGMVAGMVLGAYPGSKGLPMEWVSGLKRGEELSILIEKIS